MPTITSTGVGSGLDVNTIVTSLMTLEKRPLNLLQQQATSMQTRLSSFGTLQGQIAALGDVAKRLADAGNWNPLRVESSNSPALSATAGSKATAGNYRLEVQQMAQAQTLASTKFPAGSATVIGTGTLTLEVGKMGTDEFEHRSGTKPVSITIGPGQQTLAGISNAINAAKAGVTASVVTDANGNAQLLLRGAEGLDGTVRLTAQPAADSDPAAPGLSALAWDPLAGGGAYTELKAASNAEFTIDGLPLTSNSNSPDKVLPGLTLQFRQVTTAPVDLTVAVETADVRKNIDDFVSAYNTLVKQLAKLTQADPSGTSRGALQGDSATLALGGALRGLLQGAVSGVAGVNGLNAAGIELQRDGTLKAADKRLKPLLEDPAQLAQLFTQKQTDGDANTRGFAVRFEQWARRLTRDDGAIASRIEGLNDSKRANQKRQDVMSDRLQRTESKLRAQYQRLDGEMSRLNAEMSRLRSSLGIG